MGLRPSHGAGQWVADEAHPPAFTPAEAAQRLPREAWQRTVRYDTHGKELVRDVTELELGTTSGSTCGVRLIAATRDPAKLKPESTWYLVTSLSLEEASPEVVYAWYRLRDWIEHFYKPVKHELGWADYHMRPERALVRHWQLALLAYTCSLLVGAVPTATDPSTTPEATGGGKIGARPYPRVRGGGRAGRLDRHAAPGPQLALPVGAAAALLAPLVMRRPTARAGRAPRPRRPLSAT
jgi:hypothetical protein